MHAVGLLEHAGLLADHVAVHRETALEIAAGAGGDPERIEWSVVDGDPCSALLRMTDATRIGRSLGGGLSRFRRP